MAQTEKHAKILQYPLLVLRILAVIGIVIHLFLGFFVSVISPWIFFSTAALLALLVLREMYDDMARQFFELKSDQLEDQREPLAMKQAVVIEHGAALPGPGRTIDTIDLEDDFDDQIDRDDRLGSRTSHDAKPVVREG